MKDVSGKIAFVTGGSSGIGLGIARAFVEAGMKVVIGYQTKKHLEEALELFEAARECVHAIHVDVTDRLGMEHAATEILGKFGKVHILVNNAGVASGTSLSDATYEDWDWMMGVNLDGVFNGLRSFLPHIKAHGEGGHIVTTASVLGLMASDVMSVYSVSKFAVVGMMEALRGELSSLNIGVSVFCPGVVSSNIADAERNRPGNAKNSVRGPAPQAARGAMVPLEAGRLVLRGVHHDDLYILSHPEFEQGIRDRHAALMAAISADVPPPAARVELERSILRNPIYAQELDRK